MTVPKQYRTCFECVHYYAYDGSHGYSEWTPGDSPGLGCHKKHWEWDDCTEVSDFDKKFLSARTCDDYELKGAPK